MKLKTIILGTILLFTGTLVVGQQIIYRESVDTKIQTGTRPEAGNFGFYLGASLVELEEMIDEDIHVRGLPIMNFKYYLTDNIEVNFGSQIYSLSEKIQGSLLDGEVGVEDNVNIERYLRFSPGINYHFSDINILDTYGGVGLIVGSEKNEVILNETYNLTGDFCNEHFTKKTFVTGFNINFGMQAFIADLPFSIGAEFGITGLNHSNLQYEHETNSSVGGVVTDQTYFTINENNLIRYESLEYNKFEIGGDFRFIISYYFR